MKKLTVVVLMGGSSAEFEVSLATGKEVVRHFNLHKYRVLPLIISRSGKKWFLVPSSEFLNEQNKSFKRSGTIIEPFNFFKSKKIDLVFIAMHGRFGEDGVVQGILDFLGVRYTGSGVLASALGMNKIMFKKIMNEEKISHPRFLVFSKKDSLSKIWNFFRKPPVFVKPYNQGSSVGTSLVKTKSQIQKALKLAFSYSDPVLIEEYLSGLEISCGVLGNSNPWALPAAEIIPKNEFFDYEAKYTPGKSEEIVPARISPKLAEEISKIAIKVFKAIGACGFARIDMIVQKGKPFVLEINTIPGLTPVSILPKEAAAAGFSYSQLLEVITKLALEN